MGEGITVELHQNSSLPTGDNKQNNQKVFANHVSFLGNKSTRVLLGCVQLQAVNC